jgi:hypothetical protein
LIFHSTGAASFNGTVNGGGDGKLVLAQPLHVYPFATPGDASGALPYVASTVAFQTVGTLGSNQIWFTSQQKQFEGTDLELSDANEISLEITHTGALSISVSGPTGQTRNILVTIDSGTTTCTQVINLINGDPTASALILATLEPTSTGTNPCDVWDNSVWAGDYAQRFLVGGAPGTVHTIEPIPLADFFGAHADNPMKAGDMIGIWYDQRISPDGTVAGRLGSTPENSNTVLNAGQLFNSRRESHKIPNCIPLFKCIDDNTVIAADGTRFVKGDSGTFGGAEGSALATPLGWTILQNGPHTPPTTIREALDNTDHHLQTLQHIVTVTDGSVSTGGMYNGVDALENAINDHGTSGGTFGLGALILVKSGTYEIANAITVDRSIQIQAVGQDVTVNLVLADATYALTFASTGVLPANSLMSGLTFSGGNKYAVICTGVEHLKMENLFFACAIGINISSGKRVVMERMRFETQEQCLILQASANECTIRNAEFVTASTTVPAFTDAGVGIRRNNLEDCYFSMNNNQQAIGAGGYGLQMENIRIDCEPYTVASTTLVISGQSCTIKGLHIEVTGTGNVVASLVQITGTGCAIRDLVAILNDQPLEYTGGNNPFVLAAENLLIEHAYVSGLFLADNSVMALAEPIVAVWSQDQNAPAVIRDMTIAGFTHTGSPTGNIDACVIGCRGSFVVAAGSIVLDDITVDTSGKTYATGGAEIFSNFPPNSIIKNCKIIGTGVWARGIHVNGSPDVQVRNNRIDVGGVNWAAGIHVDSNTTTAPYGASDNCLVDGNNITMPSFVAGAGLFVGDVTGTTICNRARVTNNHVLDNSPTFGSIYFDKCDRPICMGNQTGLNLIVFAGNCTNQKPDAVTIGLGDVNIMN